MKNAILVFVGLVAGIAAANEPHEKGRLTLTFKESDPVGDFAEMKRRVPSSFDDKDDAGKDGFHNCFYNETDGLGHATPPAADIEKAFAFLDRSLHADAFAACEQAAKAVKAKRYADAAKKLGPKS